jgi:hypothetical protein
MNALIEQAIGPDSSLLGRVVAVIAIVGVSVFIYMMGWNGSACERKQEARDIDQRAESAHCGSSTRDRS